MAFSPDGTRLVSARHDDTARVWEVATGKELLTLRGHDADVLGAVFSPDGKTIATASRDNGAAVGRRDGRRPAPYTDRSTTTGSCCRLRPDGVGS